MKIDLHSHSTFSDGTLEPKELVEKAVGLGITHLGLSDHDSTGGIAEAEEKAKELNLQIIPSLEINTKEPTAVHILGYFIDPENEQLQKKLQAHRELRIKRAEMIIQKLQKMGIKISLSEFNHRAENATIGRPHIADKLKEKGLVFSRNEAFDKYLSQGRPAYVFYEGPTPQEAMEAILQAKGVPVLAHPGWAVSAETIITLVKIGLQGIEVFYPSHNPQQIQNFLETAKKFDLIPTGGSDYHGPESGHEQLGEIPVPPETVEKLLERKQKLFG